jgi:hypothetical protein
MPKVLRKKKRAMLAVGVLAAIYTINLSLGEQNNPLLTSVTRAKNCNQFTISLENLFQSVTARHCLNGNNVDIQAQSAAEIGDAVAIINSNKKAKLAKPRLGPAVLIFADKDTGRYIVFSIFVTNINEEQNTADYYVTSKNKFLDWGMSGGVILQKKRGMFDHSYIVTGVHSAIEVHSSDTPQPKPANSVIGSFVIAY